ncbi:MAG: hypothetical protein ACJA0U_002741 [Salibacteraceae bacterium]|jgi:hypothetical protein
MKIILIAFLFFFHSEVSAQYDNRPRWEIMTDEVNQLFKGFTSDDFKNVMPFQIGKKTGLFDRVRGQVLIDTNKHLSGIRLSKPSLTGYYKGNFKFTINEKLEIGVEEIKFGPPRPTKIKSPSYTFVDSVQNFSGFSIDENGVVIKCSNMYTSISEAFKVKNKYYAIVHKSISPGFNKCGIIDTNGKVASKFNFIHNNLRINNSSLDKKDVWFSEITNARERQFTYLSFKGKSKLSKLPMAYPVNEAFGFGISVLNLREDSIYVRMNGVVDHGKMSYVFNLQDDIEYVYIDYSSEEKLDAEDSSNREKADMFVWVRNGALGYYVGLDGKEYFPVEKKKEN